MKIYLIVFLAAICFLHSGCNLIAASIMAIADKQGKEKWKTENYKLILKKRQGWSGPSYYKLRFRENGLFHKRYRTSISAYTKQYCDFDLEREKDSIAIDFCRRTIQKEPAEKVKVRK